MVEELKLAVKVDDDIIEQSLLKQFNNAEKLADKVVFTFKNVNLDNKEIEKQFKDMQKLAGKNPIELPIDTDKSLKMLQALGDEFTRIISIAKGLDGIKTDFGTKNKTEAYNQLKQMADVFKKFYGNEEAMHTKAGTDAAYAYYKAYEEALKKGVAQSRLESVTVDVDPSDSFFTAEKIVYDRMNQYDNKLHYGGTTDLSEEINILENRLIKFNDAYLKIQTNLGDAPITPEILKNIEEYVRYLEIAEARTKDADLMGFSQDDINNMNDLANMHLDFAMEDAIQENEKYKSSFKEIREEKEKTTESIKKLNDELTELHSNTKNDVSIKDTFQGDVKKSIESSSSAIKEESKAMEQVDENAEKASKGKEKFSNANKKVKESADSSKKSIKEEDKYLQDLSKNINKYQKDLDNASRKPTKDNRSSTLQEKIDDISSSLTKLRELQSKMSDSNYIFNPQDIKDGNKLEATIKQNIEAIKTMSAAEKGSTEDSRWKEIRKIRDELEANTKFSKEAREQLEHYIDVLKSGDPSVNVKEIHTAWTKVAEEEIKAGRAGKSFFDIFKDKALYGYAAQLAQYYMSFYDFVRYGKAIVNNVREIDTALTELRKVSDASESRLTQNFKNSSEAAKDLGATVSDLISASADWSRMGYSIDESEELARVSTLYKNVGDGIDIEGANNSLISTLQGYQLVASEAESVVDKFNEVSNNFAITSGGIGEALQRSAASFNAANTDLSKSIALITATNEVVQDPDSVGTLWKTMSARIRSASTELEELGEETDEYTESTSKLRDLVKSLTGFDIMQDEDTFKDIYEIIMGIGKEWDNLTDIEQASLGEALAGKRNANALYAVLGNLDTLQEAYETAEKSAGSARKEQENYEKSIQYSLDRLTASAQEWSATLVDSEVIKFFVDLANTVVNLSTAITPLGTIGLGAGLFAGIKNVGINMLVAC